MNPPNAIRSSGLKAWRAQRDDKKVADALARARNAPRKDGTNIMPPPSNARRRASPPANGRPNCARVFGEYRAPTGVAASAPSRNDERIVALREEVDAASKKLGRRLTFLVAKPGLDGHSNGAEQIAIRARDAGMDVIYNGIRFSPDEIVAAAKEQQPHVIGLSILSGSHVPLAREVVAKLKAAGLSDVKVVAGGIIPPEDEAALKASGVAAVFSPKDYDLNAIMRGIVDAGERALSLCCMPSAAYPRRRCRGRICIAVGLPLPSGDIIAGDLRIAAVRFLRGVDPCPARVAEIAIGGGVGLDRRPVELVRPGLPAVFA